METQIEAVPKLVNSVNDEVEDLATGMFYSLCLTRKGAVLGMGDNS